MPVWFKCNDCGQKFYTAASSSIIDFDNECEKCQTKMTEIYYDIERFILKNLTVNFHPKENRPTELYSGKILSIDNKKIDIIAYGKSSSLTIKKYSDYHVSFAREIYPEGRYFFHSKILNYFDQQDPQLVFERPDVIERKEERQAKRYPLQTTVRYRLADDIEELINDTEDNDFRIGETLDISRTGLLLIDEMSRFEELNQEKYIDLELNYHDYNFSLIGNIARVNRLKEANGKLGLGIKFLDQNSNNLDLIEEIKNNKIAN